MLPVCEVAGRGKVRNNSGDGQLHIDLVGCGSQMFSSEVLNTFRLSVSVSLKADFIVVLGRLKTTLITLVLVSCRVDVGCAGFVSIDVVSLVFVILRTMEPKTYMVPG